MATVNIFKETAVPATWVANSIYFITSSDPNYVEMWVTNAAGDASRRIPRKEDIESLIATAVNSLGTVEVVADIAARDALSLTTNTKVWVKDASGDPTVTSGGAEYIWEQSAGTFTKTSEFESMDVVLDWANLANKPTSSVAAIDQAVTKSHEHTNKTQLDKIGEDGDGDPTYATKNFVMTTSLNW